MFPQRLIGLTLVILRVGDAASFVFHHLRPSYRLGGHRDRSFLQAPLPTKVNNDGDDHDQAGADR